MSRLPDIKIVTNILSLPQLSLLVDLNVLEALYDWDESFSIEELLDSVYGDYLFSKKRLRETIVNCFSDNDISEFSVRTDSLNISRSDIESDLRLFTKFLGFSYPYWSLTTTEHVNSIGPIAGSYGKHLISNGVPHQYQLDVKRELTNWYDSSVPSTLLSMPTGSGKTRTANEFLVDLFRKRPHKCLWLSHRSELLVQASKSFENLWLEKGDHKVSINYFFDKNQDWFSESLNSEIVYGGFDKINSNLSEVILNFDLVVIDEAHYSLADTYLPLVNRMIREGVRCLGLTATPMSGNDHDFMSVRSFFGTSIDLFNILDCKYDFEYLQSGEYLAKIVYTYLNIDRDNFHWNSKRLNSTIIDYVIDIKNNNRNVIIFAISKSHAILLTFLLKLKGVCAELIVGETNLSVRSKYLDDFEKGRITALVNHEILSTGVDVPKLNSIMVLRDFGSDNIAMQVVGRALRGPLNGGNTENTVIFPNLNFKFDITKKY